MATPPTADAIKMYVGVWHDMPIVGADYGSNIAVFDNGYFYADTRYIAACLGSKMPPPDTVLGVMGEWTTEYGALRLKPRYVHLAGTATGPCPCSKQSDLDVEVHDCYAPLGETRVVPVDNPTKVLVTRRPKSDTGPDGVKIDSIEFQFPNIGGRYVRMFGADPGGYLKDVMRYPNAEVMGYLGCSGTKTAPTCGAPSKKPGGPTCALTSIPGTHKDAKAAAEAMGGQTPCRYVDDTTVQLGTAPVALLECGADMDYETVLVVGDGKGHWRSENLGMTSVGMEEIERSAAESMELKQLNGGGAKELILHMDVEHIGRDSFSEPYVELDGTSTFEWALSVDGGHPRWIGHAVTYAWGGRQSKVHWEISGSYQIVEVKGTKPSDMLGAFKLEDAERCRPK